jgi:hypothetical protein
MKKKILGGLALLVIAVMAAWNVNLGTNSECSTVSLANVEALAQEFALFPTIPCEQWPISICIFTAHDANGNLVTVILDGMKYKARTF